MIAPSNCFSDYFQLYYSAASGKKTIMRYTNKQLLPLLLLAFLVASCEDNPVSSETSEHAPAIGYKLLMDDEVLVRYFQRQYTIDPDGNFEHFAQGDSALVFRAEDLENNQTDPITIRWIDQNEVVFDLAQYGEESGGTSGMPGDYNLLFQYMFPGTRNEKPADERSYQVIYDKNEETWKFSLELIEEGQTDVSINLFHIDHSDLVPVPLPVIIEM